MFPTRQNTYLNLHCFPQITDEEAKQIEEEEKKRKEKSTQDSTVPPKTENAEKVM